MRFSCLAVAISTSSSVEAFVPPAPHACVASCINRAALSELPRATRLSVASDASRSEEGLLPPKDETFGLAARLQEMLAAPTPAESELGSERYDRIGSLTGGTWRTWVLGFIPSTVECWVKPHCSKIRPPLLLPKS